MKCYPASLSRQLEEYIAFAAKSNPADWPVLAAQAELLRKQIEGQPE